MLRVIVIAAALGSDLFSDAYNLANTTPNIIYELLIGGVLSATLVPLFVKADRDGDVDGPSAVFSVGIAVTASIAALAVVAAPLIGRIYLNTGQPHAQQKLDLLVPMLQLLLPEILFYGITALTTAAEARPKHRHHRHHHHHRRLDYHLVRQDHLQRLGRAREWEANVAVAAVLAPADMAPEAVPMVNVAAPEESFLRRTKGADYRRPTARTHTKESARYCEYFAMDCCFLIKVRDDCT